MTKAPFARALVRKGKGALRVATLALNAGDNDSAVSRSYYAMFDFAQAALLRAGVTEDKLPRTDSGIIEAFRRHAVQPGLIDRELAKQFSRTESLRIKADYTGNEIELSEAREVVQKAELFVQTVERVFNLDNPSLRIPSLRMMMKFLSRRSRNWSRFRQKRCAVRRAKIGYPNTLAKAMRMSKALLSVMTMTSSAELSRGARVHAAGEGSRA